MSKTETTPEFIVQILEGLINGDLLSQLDNEKVDAGAGANASFGNLGAVASIPFEGPDSPVGYWERRATLNFVDGSKLEVQFGFDYLYPVPGEAVAASEELRELSRNGKDPIFFSPRAKAYISRVKAITRLEVTAIPVGEAPSTGVAYSYCFYKDEYSRRRGAEEALRRFIKDIKPSESARGHLWKIFLEQFGTSGNPSEDAQNKNGGGDSIFPDPWNYNGTLAVNYTINDPCEDSED